MDIRWQVNVTDLDVLDRAGLISTGGHDYICPASLDGTCDSHGQLPHPTSAPLWGYLRRDTEHSGGQRSATKTVSRNN